MTMTAELPMTRANANGGAMRRTEPKTFADLLLSRQAEIAKVLPKHMTVERMIKLAQIAVSRNPTLGQCTPLSLYVAVMKAAELGLDCSGTLGSAYLVPFKNNKKINGRWDSVQEAQLIIGYRGLIDLARRSGQIVSVEAHAVYANDEFEMTLGTDGRIHHKPQLDNDPGAFRLVYFVCKLVGGGTQTDVMTKAACDAIRSRSRAKDSGPWVTDYVEMCRKTVVKRGLKYCPMSVELADALSVGDEDEDINSVGEITSAAADINSQLAQERAAQSEDDQTRESYHEDEIQIDSEPVAETKQETPTAADPAETLHKQTGEVKPPADPYASITTWAAFVDAMNSRAQAKEIPTSVSSKAIGAIAIRKGWKGANEKKADPVFLREILAGVDAGEFNWKTAWCKKLEEAAV